MELKGCYSDDKKAGGVEPVSTITHAENDGNMHTLVSSKGSSAVKF